MNVWNGIDAYPESRDPVIASIGNYDGVHVGHATILDGVVKRARETRRASLLITFDPHPLAVVAPDRRPLLIQTRHQKLAALEATGLEGVLILAFDRELSRLTGEGFFHEVLDGRVSFAAIHVGETFRFGAQRSGDHTTLAKIGAQLGFEVRGIPPVQLGDETVSSSAIRDAIARGEVSRARAMLGRPYSAEGEVVRGAGRGRKLEFPTANLAVENEVTPAVGVYVTEALVDGSRYPSVTNVGTRPTFDGEGQTVEAYLLDFEDDLYDRRIELRFLERIRDERKFPDADALRAQIALDVAAAESFFQDLSLEPR